jgi:hypothetical protein
MTTRQTHNLSLNYVTMMALRVMLLCYVMRICDVILICYVMRICDVMLMCYVMRICDVMQMEDAMLTYDVATVLCVTLLLLKEMLAMQQTQVSRSDRSTPKEQLGVAPVGFVLPSLRGCLGVFVAVLSTFRAMT